MKRALKQPYKAQHFACLWRRMALPAAGYLGVIGDWVMYKDMLIGKVSF